MVHCQDRNSRSLGCTVNKNSACAEGPGRSCKPAFASPHKDRERHHWNAGVRGPWMKGRKPANGRGHLETQHQKVLPEALTTEEDENNRTDPGTSSFCKTRERCPERYHNKEGPGLGIQAQNKVWVFFFFWRFLKLEWVEHWQATNSISLPEFAAPCREWSHYPRIPRILLFPTPSLNFLFFGPWSTLGIWQNYGTYSHWTCL